MPWSKVTQVHDAAIAAAHKAYDELGVKGWIMSHMSHSYHSGACLYFTFAFVYGTDPLGEYDHVKSAIQQAFVDNGSSISHHHGVGLEHAPWLEQDISSEGVKIVSGLFAATDPASNLNPRKIIADAGKPTSGPGVTKRVAATAAAKPAAAKAPAKKKAPVAS
jgi:alkyldihydroxyacetonephosphate synthase